MAGTVPVDSLENGDFFMIGDDVYKRTGIGREVVFVRPVCIHSGQRRTRLSKNTGVYPVKKWTAVQHHGHSGFNGIGMERV